MHHLKQTGITSVGDCIDHFARDADAMISARLGFLDAMDNEVKPKLVERGYLRIDENK
jgi:hypothetical protein